MVLSVWTKTQSKSVYGQARVGGWTLGPFSKFSLPALVRPTQTYIYRSIKKSFLDYFSKGMWHWTKHSWFSLSSTTKPDISHRKCTGQTCFPVSRDFHTHADYAALHYLFKEGEANEKKLNMETEISHKKQKLPSKFIEPTCNRKQSHYQWNLKQLPIFFENRDWDFG